MAKNSREAGPSDLNQPGEPLHLLNAEVVPGTNPESAQIATTAAVLAQDDERAAGVAVAGDPAVVEPAQELVDGPEDDDDEDRDDVGTGEADVVEDPDEDDDEDPDEVDDNPGEVDEVVPVEEPEDEVVTPGVTTSTIAYDPSLYNVVDVNAYLDRQLANGDDQEVRRVLDAELAGKSRAGVLDKYTRPE